MKLLSGLWRGVDAQLRPRNAYCSFCRRGYYDVGPLVEGPGSVFICENCVTLCADIIEKEKNRRSASSPG
jgi:ATP-dependent Clp protease ATP-binding subunit ClpX